MGGVGWDVNVHLHFHSTLVICYATGYYLCHGTQKKCEADDVPKKKKVLGKFITQILTTKISKSIRRHSATNIFEKTECGLCHGCLRVVHHVVKTI